MTHHCPTSCPIHHCPTDHCPTTAPPQLCGVTDVTLLVAIAALMASCMLFGWQMEVHNGDRLPSYEFAGHTDAKVAPALKPSPSAGLPFIVTDSHGELAAPTHDALPAVDWTPFYFGCWPFLAAVAITGTYFFQAVSAGDPPAFVW